MLILQRWDTHHSYQQDDALGDICMSSDRQQSDRKGCMAVKEGSDEAADLESLAERDTADARSRCMMWNMSCRNQLLS